jgi:hypothetical protein
MSPRKIFLSVIVLLEWFSLIAQLILHMKASPAMFGEALARYFSFFTVLTNIMVALYTTNLFFTSRSSAKGFFHRASVQTAITLYITIVGLVYNIVLRTLWDPHGLQAVVDDLLHTLLPVLAIIYWYKWINTKRLHFSNIPAWLIYPAVYSIVIFVRGPFAKWYPYPFLNVEDLGYPKVILNTVILVFVFLIFSILFVFVGKKKNIR